LKGESRKVLKKWVDSVGIGFDILVFSFGLYSLSEIKDLQYKRQQRSFQLSEHIRLGHSWTRLILLHSMISIEACQTLGRSQVGTYIAIRVSGGGSIPQRVLID
jgi:hypothetical protein